MTIKLYYENPGLAEAFVQVIHSSSDEKGDYAVLDQTPFYPEGGGQPADTGMIGEAKVLDVQTIGTEIRHYTDRFLEQSSHKAEVDWGRRWDHMQQHAGQHILSAVFDDAYGMKTQSFHLGEERVSIDLDRKEISPELLQEAEEKANEIIRRHIPVTTEWVTEEQAAGMPLRKPAAVKGPIRLVRMEGVDLNACGGTHPENTADIGQIRIIASEKAKGGIRLYFLCGNRAAAHFRLLIRTTDMLVRQLNAPVPELEGAAASLLKDKAAAEKEIKEMKGKLLEMEAAALEPDEGSIERVFSGRPFKEIQQLAKMAVAGNSSAYVLFLSVDGRDIRFVCGRGESAGGDMREVMDELLKLVSGKGGGNASFVQGGGTTDKKPAAFIEVFRKALKNFQ